MCRFTGARGAHRRYFDFLTTVVYLTHMEIQELTARLKGLIAGDIVSDDATIVEYSHDMSLFEVRPQVVAFPKDAADVEKLVSFVAEENKKGNRFSLTGRSAGTDMSGGPLNQSIIVSFTKYFNAIRQIDVDSATVEPGVYFRDFEKELVTRGLLYPPYPASKDLCAMGGIVNNNSGGEKTLAYGKTEDYVQEVSVVLADGKEHSLRPLSGSALQEKLNEQGFEGDIYRALYSLIDKNYEVIQAAKPQVSKNSAGYYLWNVWDKKTFDITKVIVGSQGTLGLLTAARLRLVQAKKHSKLLVIFADSLDPVPALVADLLPFHPESIESYDDKTLGLALKFLPAMIKIMKGNAFLLGLQFIPEFFMVLRGGFPKMVLMVELTGDDEAELVQRTHAAHEVIKKYPVRTRLIKNAAAAQKYWTIRRQSFALLHSHVKGLYAAPFVDDIIVDPKYMPEFLPQVNAILDAHKDKLIYTIAGHPGNGNFHIIPLVDLKDPEIKKIIPEVTEQIYRLVFKYQGSITAEHNDGIIRTPYLQEMYGEKIVSLFNEVKKIFDPDDIFNPGKKVGGTLAYALEHLRKTS